MDLQQNPEIQQAIDYYLASGKYGSAEEVVPAALQTVTNVQVAYEAALADLRDSIADEEGGHVEGAESVAMSQIILTDEQLKVIRASKDAIAIRDSKGNLVGYVSIPPSPEEAAEAKRLLHSDGPWFSTRQVLDHLDSLEQE